MSDFEGLFSGFSTPQDESYYDKSVNRLIELLATRILWLYSANFSHFVKAADGKS